MEAPEERPGFAARTSEYVRRRTRQGLRIVLGTLFPNAPRPPSEAELAAAARLAAVQTDEADEPAAIAAVAARLQTLATTVATLGGELTLCDASALRPLRREDVAAMALADVTDVRGVCIGEGVVLSRGCSIETGGEGNFIVLAPNVRLSKVTITLRGSGNLVYVGPDTRLTNVVIKTVGEDNTIAVGGDVTFESGTLLCERRGRSLVLGDDCMVSNGVVVRTSDHHGIFERGTGKRLNASADVVVGAHVWLGNGCRINKGTRVGTGTVIGQMAIASGDLDAHCIYAGVPARKLREDVVWSRTERFDMIPERFL